MHLSTMMLYAVASSLLLLPANLAGQTLAVSGPEALRLAGDFRGTHDPAIAKDKNTYYVFATGAAYAPLSPGEMPPPPSAPNGGPRPERRVLGQLPIRCSADLHTWRRCGQVFTEIPKWIQTLSPATKELWAPDISFYDGLYHLYYAFSVFGKNTSGIALATNITLDQADPRYKWVDQGLVLQSFSTDKYNAIDPNLVLDDRGGAWLSFGSFWSGLKMRRLDRSTGKLSTADSTTYDLAERAHVSNAPRAEDLPPDSEAVEAPFILHHGDFYYLFMSWDLCCRGLKSTYRTMMGRAKVVTGPYADRAGVALQNGGGTPLLMASKAWLGPGGASALHLESGPMANTDLLVFHAYDAKRGSPALQISTIAWIDGWPSATLSDNDAPR